MWGKNEERQAVLKTSSWAGEVLATQGNEGNVAAGKAEDKGVRPVLSTWCLVLGALLFVESVRIDVYKAPSTKLTALGSKYHAQSTKDDQSFGPREILPSIVFTGGAGLRGNFTGCFKRAMTSVIARSSCGSLPLITDVGSLSTSISGSTP